MCHVRLLLSVFALTFIVAIAGCGGTNAGPETRLVGKWRGTVEVDEQRVGGGVTPDEIAQLKATTLDIEFQADGTMKLSGTEAGQATSTTAKWKFVAADGDVVTIESQEGESPAENVKLRFSGNEAFSMPLTGSLADAGAIEFRKLR